MQDSKLHLTDDLISFQIVQTECKSKLTTSLIGGDKHILENH